MKRKILLSVGIMLLIPPLAMAAQPLPEPGTILLTASGLIGLATLAALRKKFKK
jgi:hypothetical protein